MLEEFQERIIINYLDDPIIILDWRMVGIRGRKKNLHTVIEIKKVIETIIIGR